METAMYEVVARGGKWFVLHDEDEAGPYLSQEAAFEAAIPAISLTLHDGLPVQLNIAPAYGENDEDYTPVSATAEPLTPSKAPG